jgi:hypothetical protein
LCERQRQVAQLIGDVPRAVAVGEIGPRREVRQRLVAVEQADLDFEILSRVVD